QYDSDLTINVLDNTVHDLSYMGIRFGQFYDFRNVTITVDNNDFRNTLSNWMDYGMYISEAEHDGYLQFTNFYLAITNNNFENLTQYGFVIYDIYNYRYTTIDALNNYMSDIYGNFDVGLYIGDDIGMDDPSYDGEVRINILNNEVRNLYWWGTGIYFEDIYNFRQTWITVDNNNFYNDVQYTRTGYGIYFDYVYYDSDDYDTYFWGNFTNNHFENMYQEGITVYEVYGFRHVYLDFLDNSFSDIHNSFNTGIYFDYIYYNTDYDSDLRLNILRNTFMDLSSEGFYCYEIYDFRNMWITIEYNDFINTISNWMDYGVRFRSIYYNANSHDSSILFDVNNNTFQDLNNHGIYVSQIYNIRHVDINIHYNDFSDIYDSFNYGVYFSSDIYYTTSYPGSFDLMVNNNNFNDLTSYAVRFNQIRNFQDTDMVVQDNDFSRSDYGFYISGGVDYAYDWYFLFTRNNGDDMETYMLYLGRISSGEWGFSQAQIVVTDNTMSNSWDGFYIGDIYYYDLSAGVLVENNDLLDMYNGYGIEFGWFSEDPNAYFSIQGNTITGNMWAAIYLDGCEDMAFVMDIINNDIYGAQNAIYLYDPVYGDNMFTVGTINIMQNDVQGLKGYGIYIDEVYWGLMDLNVENNLFRGDPVAYFGVTFFYFDYADWNSISNIDITDNIFEDGFYGFYFRYQT
ncbi:MAG: right-handed parallel beta-helix repeat-containing protein, partial [Thermoplasmata archaeon]|nr:right-handed parallel beta-helix repeat-containing protein [Thermoplasmata archaeon]